MIDKLDKKKLKEYLESIYGKRITITNVEKRGSGVIGTAFIVEFTRLKSGRKTKFRKILKALSTKNLGNDHFSDRAQSLILANDNYNRMTNHVKSKDVCAVTNQGIISMGKMKECLILMDEVKGSDLFKDFQLIKDTNHLTNPQKQKITRVANALVDIHKKKASKSIKDIESINSLYRRRIRDTVGSGESIMGVFDAYPHFKFTTHIEVNQFVKQSVDFWSMAHNFTHRLCQVHGDYHPGNLWFERNKLTLLDRARGEWGEPADDVAAFLINPILFSVIKTGKLEGAMKQIFDIFWNTYFKKTKDREMRKVLAAYFAFRVAVVCNPEFYPDKFFGSEETARKVRRKLFSFAVSAMRDVEFDPLKVNIYLEGTHRR